MGVILTITLIMMTGLAIARERERGTFENLLAMPVRPIEIMLGKLVPYILVAYIQVIVILVAARALFAVPIHGSPWLLFGCTFAFIVANLSVGLLFSTLAKNQMQAMQMSFLTLLPSILLSGFVFPFDGMPRLAQLIAQLLPLTHFVEIVRGIVLRGAPLADMHVPAVKLVAFFLVTLAVATLRFRKRLD